MKLSGFSSKNIRWPAIILGMTMPGLGQIHNGELLKGLCFFAIYQMIAIAGLRSVVLLPDNLLVAATGLVLFLVIAFYLWTIAEAARKKIPGAEPGKYNRWYFYLAIWLICMAGINSLTIHYVKSSSIEAFKIAGQSMQPAVLRGDFVLVDKTAYQRHAPCLNDVVVLTNPDNRSMVLLRKIAALPGQPLPEPTEGHAKVPHGMVYVSGENPEATGSAYFGFIPLRDLLGKARQVYWSSGSDGIRWDRIGMKVSPRNECSQGQPK